MASNIFEQLSIIRTTNELDSKLFKNKKRVSIARDPFVLLVDLLKVLVGESGIEKGINNILKSLKKYQTSFKGFVKHEIEDVLGGKNNKVQMESEFTINILKLSPDRMLMTSDKNRVARFSNFEKKINTSIRNDGNLVRVNKHMDVSYNKNNGDLTFHFTVSNKPHIDFLIELIDEMEVIELTNIYYDVLDSLFNFSKKGNKELVEDAKINMIFSKFITEDDIDDSYYKFSDDEVKFMEETIKVRNENFYGEPSVDGEMTENDFDELVKGNRKMHGASFLTALSEIVTKNVFYTDKSTAKKNFFERFLTAFKNVILKKYLLSTEILVIYNILYKTNHSASEFIKERKNFFMCIHKQLINLILLTLFAIVKKEIGKLMGGMAKSYTKEVLMKYRNILSSII